MENIVVIGGGGHARVLISVIKRNADFAIIGYTDENNCGELLGVKYLGSDSVLMDLIKREKCRFAALGVGQIKVNRRRESIISKLENIGFEFPAIISRDSIINDDVTIGKGTLIVGGAVINSGTRICNYSIINTGAIVDHDCEIGDFTHIATGAVLCGGIKVGKYSMVGAGATVIQYKEIGEGCMIGAGAVVAENLNEPGEYMGIPARKVK